jgi:hypothetical protein
MNAARIMLLVFAASCATQAPATEVVIRGVRAMKTPQAAPVDPREPVAADKRRADAAAIEEKVRAFLERFIDAEKTPAEQVALFTDDVEYYEQGMVGKRAIERDVARYVRHWPQRSYRVVDVPYIAVDPLTDRVFVSYTISYEVASATRHARGKADYGAVISNLDGDPKVEWIRERIAGHRQPTATDDE